MLTKDESSPLPLHSLLRLSSSLSLHLREKETPIPSSSTRFLSSSATFWVSEKTQLFWASSLLRLLVAPRAVSMAGRYDKNPFDEEEVNPFAVSICLCSRCSFCTVALILFVMEQNSNIDFSVWVGRWLWTLFFLGTCWVSRV